MSPLMPRNNSSGKLKPSTNSFNGVMPKSAKAWFRLVTSRLSPKSELLTTRKTLLVSAGSFSMQSLSAFTLTVGEVVSSNTRIATTGRLYSRPHRSTIRSSVDGVSDMRIVTIGSAGIPTAAGLAARQEAKRSLACGPQVDRQRRVEITPGQETAIFVHLRTPAAPSYRSGGTFPDAARRVAGMSRHFRGGRPGRPPDTTP